MKAPLTRRGFIRNAAVGSAALTWLSARQAPDAFGAEAAKPALLGGAPVHHGGWSEWPTWRESWEPDVIKVLRSGKWYRGDGGHVAEFEAGYAKLLGAKRCLATASGTTALLVSLHVMDVDAGDEVIVSPYTFIATYNAILINKALPVLADTDPATLSARARWPSRTGRGPHRKRGMLPRQAKEQQENTRDAGQGMRKHRFHKKSSRRPSILSYSSAQRLVAATSD